ncbi:MAG: KEOPS complex subunit Pcc1 [Candidatus Thermoplasmatota archaeon]
MIEIAADASEAIAQALMPEASSGVPGTKAEVSLSQGMVRISLCAEDISALRAAVNSYLRWVKLAEEAIKASKEGE